VTPALACQDGWAKTSLTILVGVPAALRGSSAIRRVTTRR
jgi:hypothetical protein